jgi:hypothetical protein
MAVVMEKWCCVRNGLFQVYWYCPSTQMATLDSGEYHHLLCVEHHQNALGEYSQGGGV